MSRKTALVVILLVGCPGICPGQSPRTESVALSPQQDPVARLGASTRAPTEGEAATRKLPFAVRVQGQMVTSVTPGGPAASAGIAEGDVILALGANTLFSRDDVEDFLAVTKPGTEVSAHVLRRGTSKAAQVAITLGRRKVPRAAGIRWRHAGLAQLDTVLKLARDDRKSILVGLSGAET